MIMSRIARKMLDNLSGRCSEQPPVISAKRLAPIPSFREGQDKGTLPQNEVLEMLTRASAIVVKWLLCGPFYHMLSLCSRSLVPDYFLGSPWSCPHILFLSSVPSLESPSAPELHTPPGFLSPRSQFLSSSCIYFTLVASASPCPGPAHCSIPMTLHCPQAHCYLKAVYGLSHY